MIMFPMNPDSSTVVILLINVLFYTCSAVIVNIDNIGDVVEGSDTRITCNIVRSSPSSVAIPTVTWNNITNGVTDTIATFQGGAGSIQPSYMDRFSVEGDTTLVIANTLRSDSGTYQCIVTVVDDPPTSASDDVTLSVTYIYKPVLSSFATPVVEGDIVEMSCSADANPAPTYTFKKDGVVQQQGGSSTLTFQTVSRNKDGNYECDASNSVAIEISDSRMLEVYYAPEITPLSNMQVSPGATVVISFDVVTKPTANYVWTTTPDTTDTDCNQDTYTINVSDNIDETYTVMLDASNEVGPTQASVEVKVVASDGCAGSNTGLVVGMTFVGFFIGILLSSSVFVVLMKMKNSKAQVTEVTSRNDKQPAAYMAYRGEPNTENQTYEDLQRDDDDNPVVYVNVKVKKEKR